MLKVYFPTEMDFFLVLVHCVLGVLLLISIYIYFAVIQDYIANQDRIKFNFFFYQHSLCGFDSLNMLFCKVHRGLKLKKKCNLGKPHIGFSPMDVCKKNSVKNERNIFFEIMAHFIHPGN